MITGDVDSFAFPYYKGYNLFSEQYKNPINIKIIRSLVIEANFTYNGKGISRTLKSSLYRFCKISISSLKLTYEKGQLGKAAAYVACAIGLAILVGTVAYLSFIYLSSLAFLAHLALFAKVGIGNGVLIGAGLFLISKLISNHPLLINSKIGQFYFQHLERLATYRGPDREDSVEDPITFEPISEDQLQTPQIVVILKQCYLVSTALSVMLNKSPITEGGIPDPILPRDLNSDERDQFLNHMCFLFCLNKPDPLINCWNISKEERQNQQTIALAERYYGKGKEFLKKSEIEAFIRREKFLALIPQESRQYVNIQFHNII